MQPLPTLTSFDVGARENPKTRAVAEATSGRPLVLGEQLKFKSSIEEDL